MSKKPKLRPKITRIKLNPEQAVLTCACWHGVKVVTIQARAAGHMMTDPDCIAGTRTEEYAHGSYTPGTGMMIKFVDNHAANS